MAATDVPDEEMTGDESAVTVVSEAMVPSAKLVVVVAAALNALDKFQRCR